MGGTMIERKEGVLGGKPVIKGTRISVQLISDYLTAGHDVDTIQHNYPHLSKEQITAALNYIIETAEKEKKKLEPQAV